MTDRPQQSPSHRASPTGPAPARRARAAIALLLGALIAVSGCTTVLTRSPVPQEEAGRAQPYGMQGAPMRTWGDSLDIGQSEEIIAQRAAFLQRLYENHPEDMPRKFYSIAFSGGGPDGAFGAGLLAGWTERGDRPEFGFVSGVSTGAIIALYAFLGSEYDEQLKEIYTSYTTDDLVTPTIFAGLTGGTALLDTRGYRRLIESYVTPEIVEEVAEGYRAGRVLIIGTTNIDASRPVVWNIGAIAASGHRDRVRLIHDVIQASSAIPAAFPPVLIPVEANGKRYDEMHVDGGATQQVILYSPQLRIRDLDEALGTKVDRTIYVVVNNKLEKPYDPVRPRLFSIAAKAASSLIGGSGSGDIYRIFSIARRDGMQLNVIAIPSEFDAEPDDLFDPVYMQSLYDLGYEQGRSGEGWSAFPLDYSPEDVEVEARAGVDVPGVGPLPGTAPVADAPAADAPVAEAPATEPAG
ncbi:MAG: patatin-like phospholipase family protein [Pseudomonadota bacterium]